MNSLEQTREIAEALARKLQRGDVVTLAGTLGAGKTTFAQFLIRALAGQEVEVISPTFTLLQTYPVRLADGTPAELYHYDLYRIEHADALAELGLEEASTQLSVIEWPERLEGYPLPVTLALCFTLDENGGHHLAVAHGDGRFKDILS